MGSSGEAKREEGWGVSGLHAGADPKTGLFGRHWSVMSTLEKLLGDEVYGRVVSETTYTKRKVAAEVRELVQEACTMRAEARTKSLLVSARERRALDRAERYAREQEAIARAERYVGVVYRRGHYYGAVPTSNGEQRELHQRHQVAEWAARDYDQAVRFGQEEGVDWAKGLPLNFPNDPRTSQEMFQLEMGIGLKKKAGG